MGKKETRECSRIGPIGRRWFGARRERRRGFGLGERGERLEGARIELGGGGWRRGVRGFGSPCPLLLNHRESAEKRWVWGVSVHWDDGGCIVFWVLRQSVRNGNFLKLVAWELGSRIGKEVSLEIWLLMGCRYICLKN
jgi:hypothetical protein